MVKLVEIQVNQEQRTFDRLKNIVSTEVDNKFNRLSRLSNGFMLTAYEALNPEEIATELDLITELYERISGCFDEGDQTHKMCAYLLKFISNK